MPAAIRVQNVAPAVAQNDFCLAHIGEEEIEPELTSTPGERGLI
jgi:hypothetical protein